VRMRRGEPETQRLALPWPHGLKEMCQRPAYCAAISGLVSPLVTSPFTCSLTSLSTSEIRGANRARLASGSAASKTDCSRWRRFQPGRHAKQHVPSSSNTNSTSRGANDTALMAAVMMNVCWKSSFSMSTLHPCEARLELHRPDYVIQHRFGGAPKRMQRT